MLGTLVVHAGLFAWLATRPVPPPPEQLALHDVEIWDASVMPPPQGAAPEPVTPRGPSSAEPEEPEEPAPVPDDPSPNAADTSKPSKRTPAGPDAPGQAEADADTNADPDDDTAVTMPEEGGGALSLSGLRRTSRTARTSVQRPTIDPPTHSRAMHQSAGDAAIGPAPRDVAPRSLAEAGFRPQRRGDKLVYKSDAFRAILHPDGRMTFRDIPRKPSKMPGMAEALRAASGQELFITEKRKLLEQTYELRVQMAVAYAERNIEKRLRSLYRELVGVWHDDDGTPEERRKQIFERWDECEEAFGPKLPGFVRDSPESIDSKRREAGESARDTIEQFVRTQLPEGSADAYSASELRRLNERRRSRERFSPYKSGG